MIFQNDFNIVRIFLWIGICIYIAYDFIMFKYTFLFSKNNVIANIFFYSIYIESILLQFFPRFAALSEFITLYREKLLTIFTIFQFFNPYKRWIVVFSALLKIAWTRTAVWVKCIEHFYYRVLKSKHSICCKIVQYNTKIHCLT